MRVRVDEAGRDDAAIGVDHFRCAVPDLADLGDLASGDGNVGLTPRRAGAVDDGAVPDQRVVAHPSVSSINWGKR